MQFLNTGALWAISFIILPIIIHLFAFRRPQRVIFSNVRLLQNVKQATNSAAKLKHILILTSRILAIVAVGFLFAQPFLNKNAALNKTESIFIYMDNSASMQNYIADGNSSLLSASLKSIIDFVNDLPKSVSVKYLDNSFSTDHIEFNDKKELSDRISATDYIARWRNPGQIINRISKAADTKVGNGLFYFSDFQKNSFSESSLTNLKNFGNVQLVHLNSEKQSNLYVDSIYLADEFIRINEPFNLTVSVKNTGTENRAANVRVLVGATQIGTSEINVNPNSGQNLNFSIRLTDPKEVICQVIIEDQPVVFDNEYFFRLQPSDNLKVICVKEGNSAALDRVFSNEPIFKYHALEARNVNYQELEKADLIILSELAELGSGLIDNIKRQVQNGASVLVIPSGSMSAPSYQNALSSLGVKGIKVQNTGQLVSIKPPSTNDPWFSNVFEKLPKGMQMPKASASLFWSRAGEDILKFSDGGNYLSGFRSGSGNVYLLAAPLTVKSDFSANALFVPVMYKIAMHSMQNQPQLAYSIGQGTVRIPLKETENKETIFKLEKDGIQYIPEQQLTNGEVTISLPGELETAGFYKLTDGKTISQTIALNYDKRESELDAYSADELKAMAAPYRNIEVVESDEVKQIGNEVKESYFGTPLWKYALLICLFALALEIAFIRLL